MVLLVILTSTKKELHYSSSLAIKGALQILTGAVKQSAKVKVRKVLTKESKKEAREAVVRMRIWLKLLYYIWIRIIIEIASDWDAKKNNENTIKARSSNEQYCKRRIQEER